MRSSGSYDSGRKNHGGEVLVVALPRAKAAAGTSKSTSLRRPKACPVAPGDSQSRKSPFDVHPKNFTNYRLLWEIYKSNRE